MQASRFWQAVRYVVVGVVGMALIMRILLAIARKLAVGTDETGSRGVQARPGAETLRFAQGDNVGAGDGVGVGTAAARHRFLPRDDDVGAGGRASGRARSIAGVGLLLVVIVGTFLYSGHVFFSILSQSGEQPARAAATQVQLPSFERGIIYPQWTPEAYGSQDTTWQQEIGPMKEQTGAQWIEMTVLFSQASPGSTLITTVPGTPTVSSFTEGIEWAHAQGYKVFFVPLMQVRQPGMWSGSITFSNEQQEQAWFDGYWQALEPYVAAAASQQVEQMAIGTELQTLQQIVPDTLWNQLIARIRGVFSKTLTYDMNWSSLSQPMPGWLKNPALTYVGVSTYIPLLDAPGRVDPAAMPALWRDKIKTQLDSLSIQLNKPVLVTEIGYRNSADALYRTWEATSTAHSDPQEQAGAYDAALSNVFSDAHIAGTFFWGWDDVGMFAIKGQPASQVLLKWYSMATR